jgi:hypothetical protein
LYLVEELQEVVVVEEEEVPQKTFYVILMECRVVVLVVIVVEVPCQFYVRFESTKKEIRIRNYRE